MAVNKCCNPYVNIPTEYLLDMISGLQNLNIPLYQNFLSINKQDVLATIIPISSIMTDSRYLLIKAAPTKIPTFFSVNEQSQGILLADYKQINAIKAIVVSYKSSLTLVYKNVHYRLRFPVADIDQLIKIKSTIMNTFSMNGITFVLWDYLILHFTRFTTSETPSQQDPYYRLSYIGRIDKDRKECFSYTSYDYAAGTLIGLIDTIPFFFLNKYQMGTVNRYPYINYLAIGPTSLNQIISGGFNTYAISPNTYDKEENPNHFYRINFITELQFQYDDLLTDYRWGYVPLQQIILIQNKECTTLSSSYGPYYILGFIDEDYPPISFTATTQLLNSDNTLLTQPTETVYTDTFKGIGIDWSVFPTDGPIDEPIDGYLYYAWLLDDEKMTLLYYKGTFSSFLAKYKGNTSLNDLLYSDWINNTLIKGTNNLDWDDTQGYDERNNMKTKYDDFFSQALSNTDSADWHAGDRKKKDIYNFGNLVSNQKKSRGSSVDMRYVDRCINSEQKRYRGKKLSEGELK